MAASLLIRPNTVKTLLGDVYRKLGVKGKAQLKGSTDEVLPVGSCSARTPKHANKKNLLLL